jgi:hypothetical protein
MSKFTKPIIVEMINEKYWKLAQELEYHVGCYPSEEVIVVPIGTLTDFASIPRILWPIVPPIGRHAKAAVLHDYLYFCHYYHRKKCDEVFLEAMQVLHVNKTIRNFMYFGVRLFGWYCWHFKKKVKDL